MEEIREYYEPFYIGQGRGKSNQYKGWADIIKLDKNIIICGEMCDSCL